MYNQQKINKNLYIELDSTYRDRSVYPHQSHFITNVGKPRKVFNSGMDAIDPIPTSYPIHTFTVGSRKTTGTFEGGTPSIPKLVGTSEMDNFYNGMTLINETTEESSIIQKYDGFMKLATLYFPFSTLDNGQGFSITDNTTTITIFDPDGDNVNIGKFVYHTDLDSFKKIVSFDPLNKMYILDEPFDIISDGDVLEIRSSKYMHKGTGAVTNNNHLTIDPTNIKTGDFIRVLSQSFIKYNGVEYSTTNDNWSVCDGEITKSPHQVFINKNHIIYYSRDKYSWVVKQFDQVPDIGDRIVENDSSVITSENIVKGGLNVPKLYNSLDQNSLKLITAVDETGVIFQPPFTDSTQSIEYEILQYSYDNCGYLDIYSTSQGFYEIELLDLVLPNVILDNEVGSRIAFYPFVYVEFSNINNQTKNLIRSNNPNSISTVFKCPIIDINTPSISKYVKLDSNGMKQIIQFNTTNPITFSVYLPNGELFKTREVDNSSPNIPNHNLQISALIRLSKVCL